MESTRRPRQSGITLVESAAVLGIVCVMFGVALPKLETVFATRMLETAAAQLRTDVQHARSTAVAMGQTLRLQVQDGAAGSCYVVHTGSAGSCSCTPSGSVTCSAAAQPLRAVLYGADQRIAVRANTSSMAFDAFQGTVTPTGTLTMSNSRGDQLKVVVNVMGRARTCVAAGPSTVHPAC